MRPVFDQVCDDIRLTSPTLSLAAAGLFFWRCQVNINPTRLIAIYQDIYRKGTAVKRGKLALYIVACLDIVLIALSNTLGFASAACFGRAAAHTSTTQYGWYCMPRTDGLQPERNREFAFAYKYDMISVGSPDEKVIYITFDAGYENGYADQVLDTLAAHHAPAAFFLVGHYIKSQPDIVQRMLDEGHFICSHSMNHKNMAAMTDFDAFSKELSDLDALLFEQTGQHIAKFFRPARRHLQRDAAAVRAAVRVYDDVLELCIQGLGERRAAQYGGCV